MILGVASKTALCPLEFFEKPFTLRYSWIYCLTLQSGQSILLPSNEHRSVNKLASFTFGTTTWGCRIKCLYRLVLADLEYPAMMKCGKLYLASPRGCKWASLTHLNVSQVGRASRKGMSGGNLQDKFFPWVSRDTWSLESELFVAVSCFIEKVLFSGGRGSEMPWLKMCMLSLSLLSTVSTESLRLSGYCVSTQHRENLHFMQIICIIIWIFST